MAAPAPFTGTPSGTGPEGEGVAPDAQAPVQHGSEQCHDLAQQQQRWANAQGFHPQQAWSASGYAGGYDQYSTNYNTPTSAHFCNNARRAPS